MNKDQFKKLQQKWYQILEDCGFKDAEKLQNDELVLKQSANYVYRKMTPLYRESKEAHFRLMAQWANDEQTHFLNSADKHILQRYVEGAKIKDIAEELLLKGTSRNRNSIRFIIRKYEMSWGLKVYSDKELNRL